MIRKAYASFIGCMIGIAAASLVSIALAQTVPGARVVTALSGKYSMGINTVGPQVAVVPLTAGTFVCNGTSVVTVTQAKVNSGSFIVSTLKTVGGTVGAVPAVQAIVAGTSFDIKCTASDTSTYTYFVLG